MSSDDILPLIFLFAAGVGLLTFGILIRTGKVRYWWAVPYYAAGQEPFVVLPAGLFFLFLLIAVVSPTYYLEQVFVFISGGCGLLALVFLIFKPRFLKPEWLQWLEDYYKGHISLLRREARQMGANQWAKRVKTQAGLEQWVEEVLRKHGLIP